MGLKERLSQRPVLGFALAVQERYGADRAGYLAAVITYYGFLSLFPLLLLAFSIIGFLLAGDPAAQRDLAAALSESVPGLQAVLGDNIDALVRARTATGIIGLMGLLWSGPAATEAAGFAVSRIFRVEPYGSFVKRKAWSLGTTLVLGVLALIGTALVAVVGNVSPGGPWDVLFRVLGPVVAVGIDLVLFLLAYRLLTQRQGPPFGRLWKGALFAAAVWTVLKVIGTWYVARTVAGSSAVYGTFATAVGLLLLIYLASRVLLYGAEINAVALERERSEPLGPGEGVFVRTEGDDLVPRRLETNGERSTGELVRSVATDTAALVKKEVELARQEIVEGIMAKVMGVGAFAGAGVFGLIALVMFGITLGVSLDIVLPAWLAWLLTAVAFLVLAGIAAAVGMGMMKSKSIAPEETKRTVKEDVEWARTQLKR